MNTIPQSLLTDTPAAANTVFRVSEQLRHGLLTLQLSDSCVRIMGDGLGPRVSMRLNNWTADRRHQKSEQPLRR